MEKVNGWVSIDQLDQITEMMIACGEIEKEMDGYINKIN